MCSLLSVRCVFDARWEEENHLHLRRFASVYGECVAVHVYGAEMRGSAPQGVDSDTLHADN